MRFRVALPGTEGTPAHMATQTRVYRSMADACVSLDMFTPLTGTLVFCVTDSAMQAASDVLDRLGLGYDVTCDLAKVTLVGAGMHGVPGVMARMAEYLGDAGVNVVQTADSHTTISVLVPAEDAERAVSALHGGFDLGG